MAEAPSFLNRQAEAADTQLARFILALRSRGITHPALLNAVESTPRSAFLPEMRPGLLYEGIALPLPCGEEAAEPFTLLKMLALLDVRPGTRVLEIGTGSGWLTALMARLGAEGRSVERARTLHISAKAALERLSLTSFTLIHGDGLAEETLGAEARTLDRLILTGAVESIAPSLIARLAPRGIALAPVVAGQAVRLTLFRKAETGEITAQDCGEMRIPPLREGALRRL